MEDNPNVREIRGRELAQRYTIKQENGLWFVPSASTGKRHIVDLKKQNCSCPDFELRRQKCKHIFAVEFSFEQDFLGLLTQEEIAELPKPVSMRKTYRQEWTAYNKAQQNEKADFQKLLAELCKGVGEPAQRAGRPRLPLEDMLFACVYKVYSTFSGRRFSTDLKETHQKGFISELPHYNSLFRYFEKDLLIPHLKMLVEESSLPLIPLEKNFAVDASGLSTSQGFTWLYAKYTEPRLIEKKDWLKVHIVSGTLTNVVTAVEISERYDHDSHYFQGLVEDTAQNFEMKEISGDKAYLSNSNLKYAVENNIYPYIAWKSNSTTNRKRNDLWTKLYHYYSLNQDAFLERYHLRSNVESTFSMIKAKFSGSLRSKTRTAQINEALCKILAHNICVLIQSMYELKIKPEFWLV